ncbi:uncharacterized protein PgNI_00134 [Pyricularia grisea]|uniref:Glycosyltransferase 2-like domain-containing protein n=1 Tax=Pyricularia grisea TaxID=148305 RepID=A0A6P8BGJ8_PYRGI|nr:uncharacterized protein PgNI_00134 [Pyricularia grisea]TLD15739.1 hypothetical protein PgNI_00134 [Pyricularia grisea]
MDVWTDPPRVTKTRQALNIIGCICVFLLHRAAGVYTQYPALVDLLISVFFAEYCRFTNEGRRIALARAEDSASVKHLDVAQEESKIGLGPAPAAQLSCDAVAMIVGWREDSTLWRRCLESYNNANGWAFMVVGIDGDDAEDEEMIDVFRKMYPTHSYVLHIDEPLGEVSSKILEEKYAELRKWGQVKVDQEEINDIAMSRCMDIARQHVQRLTQENGSIKHLLIHQRHLHKKGIMFTSLVFSMVIAELHGLRFLWTSDSDSFVKQDSVQGTICTMASDPGAGGASSGMAIHNADETLVTKLSSSVYWCDQYLTHAMPASVGVNDCQSGPSSAFRISAIRPILVSWYNQKVFGKRMIVNEDRHLTTLLLSQGWRVIYAGDIMTETENPTTLERWIQQQVRWARAQHIETLLPIKVYSMSHPFLFLSALRRELNLLTIFTQTFAYLFLDRQLLAFNMTDVCLHIGGKALYGVIRSPDDSQSLLSSVLWIIPGMIFYNVPQPAVHAWGLATLTADTWGTSMRSSGELAKRDGLGERWYKSGFLVVWIGTVGALLAKWALTRLELLPAQRVMGMAVAGLLCMVWMWRAVINYR